MKLVGKTRKEVELEKYEEKLREVHALRQSAYREESDGLFFDWQQGKIKKEEWLLKIAEIKARFPKP